MRPAAFGRVLSVVGAAGVLAFGTRAFACSSGSALDVAQKTQDSATYRAAVDVASAVLDQEGIPKDVSGAVKAQKVAGQKTDPGTITGTTLEAATGTLLVDRYGKPVADDGLTADEASANGEMTVPAWEQFLTTDSSLGLSFHGPSAATVRSHMLYHAQDVLSAAGAAATTTVEPAPTDGTVSGDAAPSGDTTPTSDPAVPAEGAVQHWAG